MKTYKGLLLACAFLPAAFIVTTPSFAMPKDGLLQLAEADQPGCEPGTPGCKPKKHAKPDRQGNDGSGNDGARPERQRNDNAGSGEPRPEKPRAEKPRPEKAQPDKPRTQGNDGADAPRPQKTRPDRQPQNDGQPAERPLKPKPGASDQTDQPIKVRPGKGGENPDNIPDKRRPNADGNDNTPMKPGKPDKPDRPDKPLRPDKPDRPDKPQRPDGVNGDQQDNNGGDKPLISKPDPMKQFRPGNDGGAPNPVRPDKPQRPDGVNGDQQDNNGGDRPLRPKPQRPDGVNGDQQDNNAPGGNDRPNARPGSGDNNGPDAGNRPDGNRTDNDRPNRRPPDRRLTERLTDPGADVDEAVRNSRDERANSISDVQRQRRVINDRDGVSVVVEPGGRVIVQSGDEAVIRHDDRDRLDRNARDVRVRDRRDGGRVVEIVRSNGTIIRTVYAPNGMVVQRVRESRDGRVVVLFDNRHPEDGGYRFGGPVDPVILPPPVLTIPQEQYEVEVQNAPPAYIREALTAPPVVTVQPRYTLNQVLYSPDLRAQVRSVDLDTITFDSGSWTVTESQAQSVDTVANAILDALKANPDEVFLIEGYTDAVGSVVDNLSLSDRRAEAVAELLTQYYNVPPENLVTQGYGESQLKVQTDGDERANRRVTVRRITPLLDRDKQASEE